MSNTATRTTASETDFGNLVYLLKHLNMNGVQAAMLIDELHDCIAGSEYAEIGSVDLNDVAHRMIAESNAFEVTA